MAYIKLEDALNLCSEHEEWYAETNEQQCYAVANDIYNGIANLPTAEVVEVVRCKDCKHYEIGKSYTPYCNNVMNLFEEMKPTDFCSYGEKK